MYMHNENSEYIVRYAFNDSYNMIEKVFATEKEAYDFYHSLVNVHFRCFKIKTIVTMQTVVLYERDNSNALREVKDG